MGTAPRPTTPRFKLCCLSYAEASASRSAHASYCYYKRKDVEQSEDSERRHNLLRIDADEHCLSHEGDGVSKRVEPGDDRQP